MGYCVGFGNDEFTQKIYNAPIQQGQYYCSVGAENAYSRHFIDKALNNTLNAGLTTHVSGTNAEVAPGQWGYQFGPVEGIDAADQLWLSRFILERTAENYNIKNRRPVSNADPYLVTSAIFETTCLGESESESESKSESGSKSESESKSKSKSGSESESGSKSGMEN
ncbi:glutamine synthetase-like [Hydra vulgaris]|uniref:glutamine synthetase-like n=1 Tax=Hydra vulgaris TaxID=6087 RepID=UPI0032E9C646